MYSPSDDDPVKKREMAPLAEAEPQVPIVAGRTLLIKEAHRLKCRPTDQYLPRSADVVPVGQYSEASRGFYRPVNEPVADHSLATTTPDLQFAWISGHTVLIDVS
jgi:hypothetical protein